MLIKLIYYQFSSISSFKNWDISCYCFEGIRLPYKKSEVISHSTELMLFFMLQRLLYLYTFESSRKSHPFWPFTPNNPIELLVLYIA